MCVRDKLFFTLSKNRQAPIVREKRDVREHKIEEVKKEESDRNSD